MSRLGYPSVVIQVLVFVLWLERTMRVEELQHHEKRLVELFDALDGEVNFVVRDVAGNGGFLGRGAAHFHVVLVVLRLVVGSTGIVLIDVIIEAHLTGICRKMPFANGAGLISIPLQYLRQRLLILIELRFCCDTARGFRRIGVHAIQVAVFPRKKDRTARRAQCVGCETIVEAHAFICQPINVRCAHQLAAVATDDGERNTFDGDPEYVRFAALPHVGHRVRRWLRSSGSAADSRQSGRGRCRADARQNLSPG